MRCGRCDYRLWNLVQRRCPECGSPFRPSQFEFAPSAVEFCCPQCGQRYFGTDDRGHLDPPEFDCVRCGQHLHMDSMVIRPCATDHDVEAMAPGNPWLERRRSGHVRAWFATVGLALLHPMQLMAQTPQRGRNGGAWGFALLTHFLISALVVPPACVASSYLNGLGPPTSEDWVIAMLLIPALALAVLLLMLLWALLTHGVLRLTGRVDDGVGRTLRAFCYASGANIGTAIPGLGLFSGWLWWLVASVQMVRAAQRVSALRAACATLLLPVVVLLVGIVFNVLWFAVWLPAARAAAFWFPTGPFTMVGPGGMGMVPVGAPPLQSGHTEALAANTALLDYANTYGQGFGPVHAAELVLTLQMEALDFVLPDTGTCLWHVPIGTVTLSDFEDAEPAVQRRLVDTAVAAQPTDVSAHRVGDLVFVYHSIDLHSAPGALWLVLASPDPDHNSAVASASVIVGLASNQLIEFTSADFPAARAAQNALRAAAGYPAIPNPWEVTHAEPARTGPDTAPGGAE